VSENRGGFGYASVLEPYAVHSILIGQPFSRQISQGEALQPIIEMTAKDLDSAMAKTATSLAEALAFLTFDTPNALY
jgi:hypothetical protein